MDIIAQLFESIEKNDLARVKEIITESPTLVNTYNYHEARPGLGKQHITPLICAAQLGHADIVRFLLERGADIHKKTTGCCEYDALLAAVESESPSLDTIKFLLEAGLSPDSTNECLNSSSLGEAARRGNLAVVQFLLERGADVNKQDANGIGQTPLMLAAEANHADVVKLLLRSNADPLIEDTWDETALAKAMKKGHESVALLIKEAMDKK